ncbi:MAG: sensor histidine kinase [Isosphaeraceae bacterium]
MQTALIGLAVVAGATAIVIAWRWSRTAREVARGLDELRRGIKPHRVRTSASGPLARLATEFNVAAADVHARIARLEQDRQQLNVVLEALAEAVIAVDPRLRLLFANAGANRLFGLDAGSVGRLIPELIRSPQVQEAIEATLLLPAPQAYQSELILTTREGNARAPGVARCLAVRGTPLPGQPSPGAVLVFRDVTELRRLERMRQDFVANASHELKTPLASIKAYTETLLDWALHDDSVNVRFLERIDEQAERLNLLILDLLSLARLESGQEVFDHRPLDPLAVIEACVEAHRDRAEAKGQAISLEFEGLDNHALIRADEEAVRQIADNLVDNAIKYTHERGSVRVRCWSDRDSIVLEVADTGIGIPRDELPRIFERFYRVDKARSREVGGTGLGLSIVKHLVQSVGGQVDVASRVGVGTQFVVRFPRWISPQSSAVPAVPKREESPSLS